MGKLGGAALTAVAPEAKVAQAAAGGGAGKAAQQRQQIDAIKAKRKPEPAAPSGPAPTSPGAGPALPDSLTDNRGAPSWWGKPDPVAAGNAGGGFALGLLAYALALTYLRGGMPAVKALAAAKLFNKTTGGA
jgi:hypothetical protein